MRRMLLSLVIAWWATAVPTATPCPDGKFAGDLLASGKLSIGKAEGEFRFGDITIFAKPFDQPFVEILKIQERPLQMALRPFNADDLPGVNIVGDLICNKVAGGVDCEVGPISILSRGECPTYLLGMTATGSTVKISFILLPLLSS